MNPTRVRIFYPADPLGVVPGGIDTFIRGLIKWAPDDLRFSLVGMTTDPVERPVRRMTPCVVGKRSFDFFPAVRVASAGQRGLVPLSLRFTAATALNRAKLLRDFDVFDFHRIEPALLFANDIRPKNAFFHQDPEVVGSAGSDMLWKHAPKAYEKIESRVASTLSSAWCVRESGVATLKDRYPAIADHVRFVPTWVDHSVFFPVTAAERRVRREQWGGRLALDPQAVRIATVGRLDTQKDPDLMLEAFARLVAQGRRLAWLVIGDGVLRKSLEQKVQALGLSAHVHFLGLRSATEIADILQAVDFYALSSAYEGMPMAMLEAMGCGLPVATTQVGEVRRLVKPGVNGSIATDRSAEAFAQCLADVIDRLPAYAGAPAYAATTAFQPNGVLGPVYENYRRLAAGLKPRLHVVSALGPLPATPMSLPPEKPSPPVLSHPVLADAVAEPMAAEAISFQAAAPESTCVPTLSTESIPPVTSPPPAEPASEAAPARAAELPVPPASATTSSHRFPYDHRHRERVVGAPIDVIGARQAREVIIGWARALESRYVCFCNVHSAVAYSQDARHKAAIDQADLVAADGAPIAWMLRRKGHVDQTRLDGPGTMWTLCRDAQARGVKVGLYGSTHQTLRALRDRMRRAFPELHVGFCESPPFRPLTAEEDDAVCRQIVDAGVGMLFVAFGCPKQELWMAQHVGRINAVMLGVGAAFDYHAGLLARAPRWAQDSGLEWLHRLASEPRRLWQRYLVSNSIFIARATAQLVTGKTRRHATPTMQIVPPRRSRLQEAFAGQGRERNVNPQYMTDLLARVDALMARHNGRLIEFIASGEGEGTSTLATAYAHVAATSLNRRVLLLSAQSESPARRGVLECLATSRVMEPAIHHHRGGYWSGSLFDSEVVDWSLAGRQELWRVLRGAFDEIVLDMPSASASHAGVMMAPHCDGVIVVLEAEKTRAPVVEALVANLHAVRANLLGAVLNKRQFHLPDAIYRRL